jgi:hypothetical protein
MVKPPDDMLHPSAMEWLLDSDPSVRRQALREFTDAPAEVVAAE